MAPTTSVPGRIQASEPRTSAVAGRSRLSLPALKRPGGMSAGSTAETFMRLAARPVVSVRPC